MGQNKIAEDDVFWNLNKFWHLWTSLNNSLNFILLRHYQMTLLEEESFCVLRWKLGSKMWQEWAHTISDTTNCFSFDYFIGRNCCGKKELQEENVTRKISQLLQLFLPQKYNFLQFASFSSRNLYSKGYNRRRPAY